MRRPERGLGCCMSVAHPSRPACRGPGSHDPVPAPPRPPPSLRLHITPPPHHSASTSLRLHITPPPHHSASTSLRLHITPRPSPRVHHPAPSLQSPMLCTQLHQRCWFC